MKLEGANRKIFLTIVILAVLGFGAYYLLRSKPETEVVLDQFGNPVQAQVVGQDLINLLNELESVRFNTELLSSPAFINLTDFAVTLTPEAPGRKNPFDPISGSRSR